ncbi:11875_t:CDS:2 [Entrophospora sp. SA101]|nr:8266_t:CDS:2 [Entrophospora sp. SA101]CAJ0824870.1 11875_t:CDS:2 [Entrophospora sp. SA101]
MDIASFFGVCVWLIPFTYFISLSANDNALPSYDPNIYSNADEIPARSKVGLLKKFLNFILQKKNTLIPMATTPTLSSVPSSSVTSALHTLSSKKSL